jgi:predicted transcriptional regulator
MATTMIRVRGDIHALLQRLAEEDGISMQDVLGRALEEYRRARLFELADAAYEALRADPEAWQQELEERAGWDVTLMDGIEPEPHAAGAHY